MEFLRDAEDNLKIATSKIENIYPDHVEALKKLKLLPSREFPKLPKMNNLWKKDRRDKREIKKRVSKGEKKID